MLKIPLTRGAQRFSISLGEKYCTITLIYRSASAGSAWYCDIATSDGSVSLCGIPVVCGTDLLAQYQHLGLGKLTAKVSGLTDKTPSYADMGSGLELYWEA